LPEYAIACILLINFIPAPFKNTLKSTAHTFEAATLSTPLSNQVYTPTRFISKMSPVSVCPAPKMPFKPLTIPQELTHSQLINYCTESLFIHDSGSARGHPSAVLDRGFEILHHLSLSFPHPSSATSASANQYKPLIDNLHSLPTPDARSLFHTLSTLLDASSFVRIELSRHRFTIGICVWAMCLGPRGFAETWAEGKMAVQGMHENEREYICKNEGVAEGLRVLNAEVMKWGKKRGGGGSVRIMLVRGLGTVKGGCACGWIGETEG
jgi:hypothetical protein